jgi:Methyltransferase domain.
LGSGPGSLFRNARPYVEFVANVLSRHGVRTVVDVGCGDWQMWPPGMFASIDRYVGFDVVEPVIEKNRAVFGSSRVEFHVADATRMTLPQSDLLLCKEVLQHLPNAAVHGFLRDVIDKYPVVVVCDDLWMKFIGSGAGRGRWMRRMLNLVGPSHVKVNEDIPPGEYRPLDYRLTPFADLSLVRQKTYKSSNSPSCKTKKAIWTAGKRTL